MKKIIVIEDDAAVQDVIKMILERAGYEAIPYADGMAILDNEFSIPDLFIIDKQLSGVDGLDICSYLKVRADTAHIPVIIISASPNVAIQARHMGADDFIEKPFEKKYLLDVIEKHLSSEQRTVNSEQRIEKSE